MCVACGETTWRVSRDWGDKVTDTARKSFTSNPLMSPRCSFWLSCPNKLLKYWVCNYWLNPEQCTEAPIKSWEDLGTFRDSDKLL